MPNYGGGGHGFFMMVVDAAGIVILLGYSYDGCNSCGKNLKKKKLRKTVNILTNLKKRLQSV